MRKEEEEKIEEKQNKKIKVSKETKRILKFIAFETSKKKEFFSLWTVINHIFIKYTNL